ncbi:MAG TPA: peptide MFS transporter [Polyangiaceae bacterium]|nr:peptide MFS transporter [Polyangiaceae bacterium]
MATASARHPEGLKYLFFAEAWERFSFYGMRALLVLYMTKAFSFDDERAYAIYGSYTALVYATPVFGGLIADKILGFRRAVVLGGVLMSLGHFTMAFEPLFYLALGLLICGNGFFKPNISTIVGRLYEPGDPRRDAGFTIFYMGINLGAFLAPLVCGVLGERYGWHLGFGLAGVGMLIGLAVFLLGQKKIGAAAELVPASAGAPGSSMRELLVYGGTVPAVIVAWQLVQRTSLVGYILTGLGIVVLIGLITYLLRMQDKVARDRMAVALVLIAVSMVFWAFFEQAGSSMNLFADRNVDRQLGSWKIDASVFQAANPAYILIFGLVFSYLWVKLAKKDLEPSIALKFSLGILQLGLGFGALWVGAIVSRDDGLVGAGWLLLGYLLHTTGELCVSPIGLSMITKLSPPGIVGMMMGTWFLSSAFAQYVASLIAALTGVKGAEGGKTLPPPTETVMVYGTVFGQIAIIALVVGLFMTVISPVLSRRTHGVR